MAESDSVKFLDVDATELSNKSGILKIQPDVQGDVELFGDTDVGDAETSKSFTIHRRAAEGDDSMSFSLNSSGAAKYFSTGSMSFDPSGTQALNENSNGNITMFRWVSNGTKGNAIFKQYGYITAAAAGKFISWQVDDTTDKLILDRQDTNILGFKVNMPLEVNGGVQIGADAEAASAAKVGTVRYRSDANNSWVEMVMQTGASTYTWEVIKTNSW